jgi:acetate kinase
VKVLVANLGSTSFKYRLFEMGRGEERLLGKGGYERVTDFGEAIGTALREMEEGGMVGSRGEIEAVGFKTVLGRDLSGCVEAGEEVLEALEGFEEVAPAHNPAYAAGIRQFRDLLPEARRVALFETAFYQWVTEAATRYAVPEEWHAAGIRRYGFHGASHKFIAERSAELLGRDDVAEAVRRLYQDGPAEVDPPLRVISCHLGGSSSVTGIRDGVAIGTSMGFSPQSGLPQNNRVGDLDSGAIPFAARSLGLAMDEIERQLTRESGLLGLSGVGNDLRDVKEAAAAGNERAALAVDVLVHETRRWASSFLFSLGGLEAFAFTAGIGENNPWLRAAVCARLEEFGIVIDPARNEACRGEEGEISPPGARVKVLVIPANEELVLAREVFRKVTTLN